MEYHISVINNADGLLRYDSPEAERFIRPVVYPTASCLLRVIAEMNAASDDEVVASASELAGRCGVGEAKIAKAMSRLAEAQHGIVALDAVDEDTTHVSMNRWLNPPRASARAQRYPPALLDEFDDFLAEVETLIQPAGESKRSMSASNEGAISI